MNIKEMQLQAAYERLEQAKDKWVHAELQAREAAAQIEGMERMLRMREHEMEEEERR